MAEKKILIVDDEDVTLTLLTKIICESGYSVITANSGREAVKVATIQKPDLIIMDIVLPDVDGVEAFQRIHAEEETSHIKVLFISSLAVGKNDLTSEDPGINAGDKYYEALAKPINPEELILKVEELLLAS